MFQINIYKIYIKNRFSVDMKKYIPVRSIIGSSLCLEYISK